MLLVRPVSLNAIVFVGSLTRSVNTLLGQGVARWTSKPDSLPALSWHDRLIRAVSTAAAPRFDWALTVRPFPAVAPASSTGARVLSRSQRKKGHATTRSVKR